MNSTMNSVVAGNASVLHAESPINQLTCSVETFKADMRESCEACHAIVDRLIGGDACLTDTENSPPAPCQYAGELGELHDAIKDINSLRTRLEQLRARMVQMVQV